MGNLYNVNVGVLGHVDSGKTSLVAALSTTLSTAALDKHPQSRERGITLDLGFSSFTVPAPPHIAAAGYSHVQFTLVDCPGHASLIRTIIGGAQVGRARVVVPRWLGAWHVEGMPASCSSSPCAWRQPSWQPA